MTKLNKRDTQRLLRRLLRKLGTYGAIAEELGEESKQVPNNWYRRGRIPDGKLVQVYQLLEDK